MTRYAIVNATAASVDPYLPHNYRVVGPVSVAVVIIAGNDDAGWTLDDYVIPRLASGLIFAKELVPA